MTLLNLKSVSLSDFSCNALPLNQACLSHTNSAITVSIRPLLSSGISAFSNLLRNCHWVKHRFCSLSMLCHTLLPFTSPTMPIISPQMPKVSPTEGVTDLFLPMLDLPEGTTNLLSAILSSMNGISDLFLPKLSSMVGVTNLLLPTLGSH